LAVAFEVLHRLKVAVKSKLLSTDELGLIEFLLAQVASLRSSLAWKVATTESPVARELMFLQSDPDAPCARHRVVGDVSAIVVRSSPPPSVALELQAIGLGESFEAKPLNIAALELGRKGSAVRCARRNA
jgi:hypothetical protein